MSPASLLTGVAAGLEFPARIGAPFVDAAGDALANGSGQGGAANRQVVGAAHAAAGTVDFNAQSVWDAPPCESNSRTEKSTRKLAQQAPHAVHGSSAMRYASDSVFRLSEAGVR